MTTIWPTTVISPLLVNGNGGSTIIDNSKITIIGYVMAVTFYLFWYINKQLYYLLIYLKKSDPTTIILPTKLISLLPIITTKSLYFASKTGMQSNCLSRGIFKLATHLYTGALQETPWVRPCGWWENWAPPFKKIMGRQYQVHEKKSPFQPLK